MKRTNVEIYCTEQRQLTAFLFASGVR